MTDNNPDPADDRLRNYLEIAAELRDVNAALTSIVRPSVYHKVRFWSALAAAMTFSVGLGLFAGSERRVSANAYLVIASYGGHFVWGAVFMIIAAVTGLCVWQFTRWLRWALLLQALPYAAIAISFAAAAVKYPDANLTAAPVYTWVTIMHAALSDYARREL
jgi:hypothetical protein